MAWLELHQTLVGHPKTKRLARRLGVSLPTAIGHLVMLWAWALEYAQDGDLSRFDEDEIAEAAGWEAGNNLGFSEHLEHSGFLDYDEDGVRIHDWQDYAGKLIERRSRNAERMRETRAQSVRGTCEATVPNRTKPNRTVPNPTSPSGSRAKARVREATTTQEPLAFDGPLVDAPLDDDQAEHVADTVRPVPGAPPGDSPPVAVAPPLRAAPKPRSDDYSPEFLAWWALYPRKEGKPGVWKLWRKHLLDGVTVEALMAGLQRWLESERWVRSLAQDAGKYVMMPATFLGPDRHWEDEPVQASAVLAVAPVAARPTTGVTDEAMREFARRKGLLAGGAP
jgi:hypothetical protein